MKSLYGSIVLATVAMAEQYLNEMEYRQHVFNEALWLDNDDHDHEHHIKYHMHDYYYHPRDSHPTAFDGSPILPSTHGFPEHRGLGEGGGHFYDQDEHHAYDVMHLGEYYDFDMDDDDETVHSYNVTRNPYGSMHNHWNTVKYTHLDTNQAIPSLKSMAKGAGSMASKAGDVMEKAGDVMGPLGSIADVGGMVMGTIDKFTKEGPRSCWLKTKGRGWGKPIDSCPEGKVKDALMCYDKCKEGYTSTGPVCWQDCPKDYPYLLGPTCKKPAPYGRGMGNWRQSYCEDHNGGKDKCEKWGLLWYPKCKNGFYAFACCICSAKCPDGMPDIGLFCSKKSYGRGLGSFLVCPKDLE